MMNSFDILVAEVSFPNGGKKRPVLLWKETNTEYQVYKITSKYRPESVYTHRIHYYPIEDWFEIGLKKASYIDTSVFISLRLMNYDIVGRLSDRDIEGITKFINNKNV